MDKSNRKEKGEGNVVPLHKRKTQEPHQPLEQDQPRQCVACKMTNTLFYAWVGVVESDSARPEYKKVCRSACNKALEALDYFERRQQISNKGGKPLITYPQKSN